MLFGWFFLCCKIILLFKTTILLEFASPAEAENVPLPVLLLKLALEI